MESGMDYQGMNNLIRYVEGKATQISSILTNELPALVPKIASAYSGEAATTYNEMLTKTAETMDTTLSQLISDLRAKTEEMSVAYKSQEQKMAESVAPINTDAN